MKRTFFIALVMCVVSSCLGTGENSWSYTLDMTFDDASLSSSNVFGADSLSVLNETDMILGTDFSLALLYKQKNNVFQGGFRLSRLKGETDGKLERPQTDLDAWRVNAAGGAANRYSNVPSTTYAVFYDNPDDAQMPTHDMEFGYKDNGTCTITAMTSDGNFTATCNITVDVPTEPDPPAQPENMPAATVGKGKARAGEQVTLDVIISKAPNLGSLAASDISYDSNALELVGFEWKALNPTLSRTFAALSGFLLI